MHQYVHCEIVDHLRCTASTCKRAEWPRLFGRIHVCVDVCRDCWGNCSRLCTEIVTNGMPSGLPPKIFRGAFASTPSFPSAPKRPPRVHQTWPRKMDGGHISRSSICLHQYFPSKPAFSLLSRRINTWRAQK